MKKFLNQPFPFLHEKKYLLFWLVELFILVTLFEYLLEPFTRNYSEHKYSYLVICFFHAGVISLSYLCYFLIVQLRNRNVAWARKHEFGYGILLLIIAGTGNFLIRDLIYDNENWKWFYFREEMGHTFIAGSFFYILMLNFNQRLLRKTLQAKAETAHGLVSIEANVQADSFKVEVASLLCFKADGNYAICYSLSDGQVKEKMVRLTLDKLEEQLRNFPQFVRTHRAFIVNRDHVSEKTGNAAGYLLTIKHLPFNVPVSRSRIGAYEQAQAVL